MSKMQYVIYMTERINDLSTELYEAMSDEEDKEVVAICEEMIDVLRHIKNDHNTDLNL